MEVKGLKELQNPLNDLQDGISPNVLLDWAKTIEQTAKERYAMIQIVNV